MEPCIVDLSSFLPSCRALTSPAGVRDFHYAARLIDLQLTFGADGTVTAAVLRPGGKLVKIQGRKFQNSGAVELAKNPTGKTNFKQTFNARFYARTQADRNKLAQLARVEDLVVFSPNNDDQIEVYGARLGLSPASGKGGTGIKLDDDNTFLFSFEGEEAHLPALFNTVDNPASEEVGFLANIAYLEGLTTAPGAPTAPGAVTGLTATPGDAAVALAWAAPAANGAPILSYTVRYRPVGATTYSIFGTVADRTATVTGLSNGQAYEFGVAATNSVGGGGYSQPRTATPFPAPVPDTHQPLFGGDSITAGYYASTGGKTYPAQLQALLASDSAYTGNFHNGGVPGQTTADALANAANQITDYYDTTSTWVDVFLLIGINSFGKTNTSVADQITQVTQLIAAYKTNSRVRVHLLTLPACVYGQNNAVGDAEISNRATAYNAAMRVNYAAWGAYDYTDLANDDKFKNPSDQTIFNSDRLHYTDLGFAQMAQDVYNKYVLGQQPGSGTNPNLATVTDGDNRNVTALGDGTFSSSTYYGGFASRQYAASSSAAIRMRGSATVSDMNAEYIVCAQPGLPASIGDVVIGLHVKNGAVRAFGQFVTAPRATFAPLAAGDVVSIGILAGDVVELKINGTTTIAADVTGAPITTTDLRLCVLWLSAGTVSHMELYADHLFTS